MKPYYEHAGITIYHGDCREVLPSIGPVDLVVTDPPYPGMAGGYDLSALENPQWAGVAHHAMLTVGDPWEASLDWVVAAQDCATFGAFVFCSYHFISDVDRLFQAWRRVMLLTWHKSNAPPTGKNVPRFDCEYVWAFAKRPGLRWDAFDSTLIDEPRLTAGCMASSERFVDGPTKTAAHPTQKPVAVLSRLFLVQPQSVLDPFMGTGTTLDAAKRHSVRGIGIEIEERYCEIAANRLSQEVFNFAEALPADARTDRSGLLIEE
jgi:site-specific DNA-methyltransferase (adenine-specific)